MLPGSFISNNQKAKNNNSGKVLEPIQRGGSLIHLGVGLSENGLAHRTASRDLNIEGENYS